ncbi:hypothetical protein P9112_007776 [Eukaryota sp. TZLM1-RC]
MSNFESEYDPKPLPDEVQPLAKWNVGLLTFFVLIQFLGGLGFGIAGLLAVAPGFLFLFILRNPIKKHVNLNRFIYIFFSILPGIIIVVFQQMGMSAFFDSLYDEDDINFGIHNLFYSLFTAFMVASFTEEVLKYFVIRRIDHTPEFTRTNIIGTSLLGFAGGLGFGIFENILYLSSAYADGGVPMALLTGVMRAASAVPFHSVTGAIMGLGLGVRKHRLGGFATMGKIIAIPFVCHGIYNFLLFMILSIEYWFGEIAAGIYGLFALVFNITLVALMCIWTKKKVYEYNEVYEQKKGISGRSSAFELNSSV